MTRKSVIGAAYVLQVLLGNVCLIDLAQAAAPDAPAVLEAPMSREQPLSQERLTCPWSSADAQDTESSAASGCESGMCMTNPLPDVPCLLGAIHAGEPAGLPSYAAPDAVPPVHRNALRPPQQSGPPVLSYRSEVMRC